MCNCIDLFRESQAMKDHNTRLLTTIPWHNDIPVKVLLEVEKIDKKKRVGPIHVIPSYCPFCGVKYEEEKPDVSNDGDRSNATADAADQSPKV